MGDIERSSSYSPTETRKPQGISELVEEKIIIHLGLRLRELAQTWGATNLHDPSETVLWTRELGMIEDYSVIADQDGPNVFVAVLKGSYLPSPHKLYRSNNRIIQVSPGNFPKKYQNSDLSRVALAGDLVIVDASISFDEFFDLGKELEKSITEKGLVMNGKSRNLGERYFWPRKYEVVREFGRRGDFFPLPRGYSCERTFEMFDRPDLLTFIVYEEGGIRIREVVTIMRADKEYLKARDKVAREVIKEMGLSRYKISQIRNSERWKISRDYIKKEVDRRIGEQE